MTEGQQALRSLKQTEVCCCCIMALSCSTGDSSADESGDGVNQRRLQLYERSKLRYYYAVAEFGSAAAAAHVYAECDGLEFERSANRCACRCCLRVLLVWMQIRC